MLSRYYLALTNAPQRVKQHIHAINTFDSDDKMSCITAVTSVVNIHKNIYLSVALLDEFTSTYYDDKNDSFEMLFQKYTDSAVNDIYHPSVVEE